MEQQPQRDIPDDTERLTYKDLGAEKALGRINSNIGKVEDPAATHKKLHKIETNKISKSEPKPYNWEEEDNPETTEDEAA